MRIKHVIGVVAAAVVVGGVVVPVTSGSSWAAVGSPAKPAIANGHAAKTNVSDDSVSSAAMTGTLKFSPGLVGDGSSAEAAKLKVTATDCTVTPSDGGAAVTITKATLSGTVRDRSNSCGDLLNPDNNVNLAGSVNLKWTATSGITPKATSYGIGSFAVPNVARDGLYSDYQALTTSVSGAFAAVGSQGALQIDTTENPEELALTCGSSSGLKSAAIDGGFLDVGAPPTSIAITPADADTTPETQVSFDAVATYPGGQQIDVANAATWSESDSNDPGIGGPTFLFGGGTGSSTVSATIQGVTASTTVNEVEALSADCSLADGTPGQPYDSTMTASGGTAPYTWSIVMGSLPPDLSLDPSTGEITGNYVGSALTEFTVQLADSSTPPMTTERDCFIGNDG